MRKSILAVIPAYYEIDNLLKVLGEFDRCVVDEVCLVIDRASRDDLDIVRKRVSELGTPIHIIANSKRKGVGYALKQGIRYGMDRHYDVVVVMAGNNKDSPKEIPRLVGPIVNDEFDYVQGSRFLPGGRKVRQPVLRGVFSRLYPLLWRLFTKSHCTDVTNGFRAFNLGILTDTRINIWQDWLDSYQLEYYIHYKVLTLGYRFREVPVSKVYSHRHKGGYSKISPLRDWWAIAGPLVYLRLGARK